MYKIITFMLLIYSYSFSQGYESIITSIVNNNKELKAYNQYLNSVNIESKFNNLPLNPEIEYAYLKGNSSSKQELIISQPFEFPTIYSIKSDISSSQFSVNNLKLKELKKQVILNSYNLLNDYIYQNKLIAQLEERELNYANILKTLEVKFQKADIGILELNKAKSSYASIKAKLNLAKVELNYLKSSIINLNGGANIEININEYPKIELDQNLDSLIISLSKNDFNNQLFVKEKELNDNKLSLAKSGWLPTFGVGYRQENEADIDFSGIQLNMSIPLFENQNKVPKAESDLNYVDLKHQAYISNFNNEKKRLFERAKLLESLLNEQRSLIDYKQYEMNTKSLEVGHISLSQFYLDNTIYYEVIDSILEIELDYQKSLNSLFIENTYLLFEK